MGYRLRCYRGVLGAIVVAVAGCCSACASTGGAPSAHPFSTATSKSATVLSSACPRGSAYSSTFGFELSIASGVTGSPTPQQAAAKFAAHGGVPGFGPASTRWVPERDKQGFMLHDGTRFLHVVRVATGGWVVDSGGDCG